MSIALEREPGLQVPLPTPAAIVAEIRPKLRGVLHLIAAVAAPFGLLTLILIADSAAGYVSASIFASSLMLLYTSSASYHTVPWPARLRGVAKRIDHSMIFALIAGTYTPFCLITLSRPWGITMLSIVWSLAGLGMLLKVAWPWAPRWLSVGLYLALGWVGIVAAREVVNAMHPGALLVVMLGGAFYTIGAVIYALKRPNPFPRIFGFHEVFHVFVLAGSLTHFSLIALYVL